MLAGLQNKAASPTKLDPRGQLLRAGEEEAGEQRQEQPAAAAAPVEQQPAVTQGECASRCAEVECLPSQLLPSLLLLPNYCMCCCVQASPLLRLPCVSSGLVLVDDFCCRR